MSVFLGRYCRKMPMRLENGQTCVVRATYTDHLNYLNMQTYRVAFVTERSVCQSQTVKELIAYTRAWDVRVFIPSNDLTDIVNYGRNQRYKISAIDLTAHLQNAVTAYSER